MNTNTRIALAFCIAAASFSAKAQLTQWNFNSTPSDNAAATGTLVPNIGSGTASLIGGTTGSFASGDASGGSTDPETGSPTNDSGWGVTTFPTQGNNSGTAGVRFDVSTVGFQDISVSWDQRFSNTSSRHYRLEYTTDGSTFTPFTSLENTGGGDFWVNGNSVDLSSITAADNNASFGFRIVSIFEPSTTAYEASNPAGSYATGGTWRFDMVTVSATPVPEPETYAAMAGVALLGFAVWRRRQVR